MSENDKVKITNITGKAIPLYGDDIDTDRIIPARFLRCVTFDGLGEYAFFDERFNDDKLPKDHVLNDPKYKGANILLVNKNFGCGSSREHAPQSLMRYGINAFVGESYSEIFSSNCVSLGLPALRASKEDIDQMMSAVIKDPGISFELDIENGSVKMGENVFSAALPESDRLSFVNGSWDSTENLIKNKDLIMQTSKNLPYISR